MPQDPDGLYLSELELAALDAHRHAYWPPDLEHTPQVPMAGT